MPQIKDVPIEKIAAEDGDYLIMQNPTTGETYKIKKINFLAGLSSGGSSTTLTPDSTFIHLLLTETSGTTASDTSGNNRNATYVNSTLNSSGVTLNGSSRISLNNSHDALSTLNVGLEFKTSVNSDQGLWEFRQSQDLSSGTYTPSLKMNASGNLAVYGYPSGSNYASQSYNDGNWHKSLIIMASGNIKIFVDKTKILDVNANPIYPFTGFFSIGATRANGNFTGQLKNFRVWDSALSEAQWVDFT